MKDYSRLLAIIFAIIIGSYLYARYSGKLVPYKIPTSANEPNLKVNSIVWTSNLKTPQRFDFIAFKRIDSHFDVEGLYIYRLCGLTGDKIEIKNGDLYVNDVNVDINLNLKYTYQVPNIVAQRLVTEEIISEGEKFRISRDSSRLFLSKKELEEGNLHSLQRYISPKTEINEEMKKIFQQKCNPDNLAPIFVPKDHYFVLGDNRGNSEDSRYWGFIAKEKIVGTLLF